MHGRADARVADVEPALAGPAVEGLADRRGWERVGVRSPVLVGARAEVTDDDAAGGLERGDRRGWRVEQIDVDHRDVDGEIEGAQGRLELAASPTDLRVGGDRS